jgi:RNA polymerase sigma-70 factor (ECF subfamily)
MGSQADERAHRDEGEPDRVIGLEERQWLPRHRAGDPAAFGELVVACQSRVYGYLTRCGIPPETRDDLFQEIFLKVHHAAARYEPARPLAPWLFTIVRNTVRNHWRDNPPRDLVGTEAIATLPAATPDVEAQVSDAEVARWLEGAVTRLPRPQREVLSLVTIGGLDLRQTATVLDLPLNTVKALLGRARRRLAGELAGLGAYA